MPSLLSKVGDVGIDTTDVGGTVSVTGIGFQPKLLIIIGNRMNNTDNVDDDIYVGIGAAAGASQEFACSWYSKNNSATSDTKRAMINDGCILILDSDGSIHAECNLDSMDSDGFTLNVVTMDSDLTFRYIALGGGALQDVYVGTDSTGTTTADIVNTDCGFQPSNLILISSFPTSWGSSANDIYGSLGMALGSDQYSTAFFAEHNQSTSDACRKHSDDAILTLLDNSAVVGSADLDSFDASGFTLNVSDAFPSDMDFGIIAFKGPNSQLFTWDQTQGTTGTEDAPASPMNFAPEALFLISAYGYDTAGGTWDSVRDGLLMSFGAADSSASQMAIGMWDVDGVGTTINNRYISDDKITKRYDNDENVDSAVQIDSMNSDDVTLNITVAEGSVDRRHVILLLGNSNNPYYAYRNQM